MGWEVTYDTTRVCVYLRFASVLQGKHFGHFVRSGRFGQHIFMYFHALLGPLLWLSRPRCRLFGRPLARLCLPSRCSWLVSLVCHCPVSACILRPGAAYCILYLCRASRRQPGGSCSAEGKLWFKSCIVHISYGYICAIETAIYVCICMYLMYKRRAWP